LSGWEGTFLLRKTKGRLIAGYTYEGRSTHIKLFRKKLHDVFNDRAFTRKTEAFQERTQSFIHSQVMEMERPKNNMNLAYYGHTEQMK